MLVYPDTQSKPPCRVMGPMKGYCKSTWCPLQIVCIAHVNSIAFYGAEMEEELEILEKSLADRVSLPPPSVEVLVEELLSKVHKKCPSCGFDNGKKLDQCTICEMSLIVWEL